MKNKAILFASFLLMALIIAACGGGGGPAFELQVNTTGDGVVTSNVGGISCGNGNEDCAATFEQSTQVTLTATPAPESWGGDCVGRASNDRCTLTVDGRKTVDVDFGGDPTAPTDDPTAPTDDPTAPTDDPTGPTDDPTGPTDDPSSPGGETPTDCGAEGVLCFPVAASNDDAEEYTSLSSAGTFTPGTVDLESSDLEVNFDPRTNNSYSQIVGIRFAEVTLPDGVTAADLTSAYIEFTTKEEEDDGELSVSIQVEDSVAPAAFTSEDNNISTRPLTGNVTWDLTGEANNWPSDNGKVRSPDLSSLLNAVSWTSGNSILFVIGNDSDNVEAFRRAHSFDQSDADFIPQLVLTY